MTVSKVWQQSLERAMFLIDDVSHEPCSAFKQAAADNGIEYGSDMEEFVTWAYTQI